MSKSRLVSGRVKKVSPNSVDASRYDFLDLSNAEPDLGVAPDAGYILITGTDGVRQWIDPSDISGFLGSQGDTGFTGSQGDIGFTGSQGEAGQDGTDGAVGEDGFTGSQGDLGFTGSQGDIGFTGSQGDIGFVGSQGEAGPAGQDGTDGIIGVDGFTGSQGPIGFTGSQGEAGPAGQDGTDGIFGGDGFTGSQGATGPAGIEISDTEPDSTEILWCDTSEAGDAVLPVGGQTGQVLKKASNNDYDAAWEDESGGSGVGDVDEFRAASVESGLSTVEYAVTVAGPQGSDTGNKYMLSGVYKPTVNFVVGYIYVFNQDDATNVYWPNANGTTANPHPLNFSADNLSGELGGGTSYLTNVQYFLDDVAVTQTVYNSSSFETATARRVHITVTSTTPATLYYWCYNHTAMGNDILVAAPGSGSGEGGETQFVKTYFYEGFLTENVGDIKLLIHRASTLTSIRIFIGEVGTSSILVVINRNGASIRTIEVPGGQNLVVETGLNIVLSENDRITVDILQGSITSRDLYVTIVYEV